MKKSLIIFATIILTLNSCEKIDKDVFFTIGSEHEYQFSDIDLYDTSAHILYFKNPQEYLNDMYENTFTFYNNKHIIYQGSFMPGYSSTIPDGPFIMSPSLCGNHALKIENFKPGNQDIRKNQKMIDALRRNNLLHSGLSISSSSIEINDKLLTLKFTIKNQDQSNLMIIDLDKTGINLFHYFTSGIHIYDITKNEVFSSNIEHQSPDPWNSWDINWLTELKAGDSKEYTIVYTLNNQLTPGNYETTFHFPGLTTQVTKEQLYHGNSRIWMGDISLKKGIIIQ